MTKGEFIEMLNNEFEMTLDNITSFDFTGRGLEVWCDEPGEFGNSTSLLTIISDVNPSLKHLALNFNSDYHQYSHQGVKN